MKKAIMATIKIVLGEPMLKPEAVLKAEAAALRAQAMVLKRAEAMVLKPEAEVIEKPPAGASLLLACVAPAGRSECVLGSAREEYRKVIVLLSPRRARWWYRVYVVKAASRMLPNALMRVLLLHKLIGLLGL